MTKHYCDACGKEITGSNVYIDIPCHHLTTDVRSLYTDSEGNRVSGRKERVDLCAACSNRIYSKAVQELNKIKKEY